MLVHNWMFGLVMGPLAWIALGALAGWLATKVVPPEGRQRGGCCSYIVVGIIGAFIGGLVMHLIGGAGITGFNLWSLFVAVLGSVILLVIVRAVTGRG